MICLSDQQIALYKLEDDVKYARFSYRDEANQCTYVYDRLLGLTSEQLNNEEQQNVRTTCR